MIIGIVGPTGSGKSAVGVALAQRLNAVIISVDAYQIYQGMDIGTGKIKDSEKAGIPHYFIDHIPAHMPYDVAQYQRDVREKIDALRAQNTPILMVGGSGYYLKAVLHDMTFPSGDKAEAPAPDVIWDILKVKAPELLDGVHPNNHKRLFNRYRRFQSGTDASAVDRAWYPYTLYGLERPLETLKKRTDARIDAMVDAGLLDEVTHLRQTGLSATAKEAIGYKEWNGYFAGVLTAQEVIQAIKTHTHQYIKKQRTYFTHQLPVHWIDAEGLDADAIAGEIMADLKNKASIK